MNGLKRCHRLPVRSAFLYLGWPVAQCCGPFLLNKQARKKRCNMSMTLIGTVKTAGVYEVNGKDNSKKSMISFSVADSVGNIFPCQMWPDDPQFAALSPVIEQYRRQQVQLTIVGYTVRMRQFKDGKVEPWANFIVSDVGQPVAHSSLSASFVGTVKSGNVNRKEGKKPYLWLNAVDEIGTTFSCQMWSDDPQFNEVAAVAEGGIRRQSVQFLVASFTLRERTLPNGQTNPQINFVVSDVAFPSLARA
jgi:hypothetical protein